MPAKAADYIPDLRPLQSFGSRQFMPAFGIAGDALNRVTPAQALRPSLQSNRSTVASLAPNLKKGGLSFNPMSLSTGTGMESLLSSPNQYLPALGGTSPTSG